MPRRTIRIGTRGSLLAMTQSGNIKEALERLWPDLQVELKTIKTTGDKILDVPLAKVGGKGLFVKEIEEALLAEEVDLAVHSMKDVPSVLPDDLMIGAIPEREDPRDVLIARNIRGLSALPEGAKVGTSSLRRSAQVRKLRPDVEVENLRGNLDTRLRKVQEGLYDAVVLAAAGLHRMGWENRITAYLDVNEFVPAIGQGAIGIEIRKGDSMMQEILAPLHHVETAIAVEAERSFLAKLEGGCQVPIGGHAVVANGKVELDGLVSSLDGREIYRLKNSCEAVLEEAASLGRELASKLLESGARHILEEIYQRTIE